ncbi:MAG: hypothetical protein VCB43_04905 [Myxococcota bacterium]
MHAMTRVVLTSAVLAFASSGAAADTITVCLDGSCDYTDIQEAINGADLGLQLFYWAPCP